MDVQEGTNGASDRASQLTQAGIVRLHSRAKHLPLRQAVARTARTSDEVRIPTAKLKWSLLTST